MAQDLTGINTVQDLLNIQEEQSSDFVDTIMQQIVDEDPCHGIEIAKTLLICLKDLHQKAGMMMIEEGKFDVAAGWVEDATKLDMAHQMIEDIEL
jgi:hypothetical protein